MGQQIDIDFLAEARKAIERSRKQDEQRPPAAGLRNAARHLGEVVGGVRDATVKAAYAHIEQSRRSADTSDELAHLREGVRGLAQAFEAAGADVVRTQAYVRISEERRRGGAELPALRDALSALCKAAAGLPGGGHVAAS